jgi:hypothetical protein
MVTERETKYGTVFNPERPHDGDNSATRTISMEIPETPGWRAILKDLKRVAVDRDCSASHLYRDALLDYHAKLMQTDTTQPPALKPEGTATTETKPAAVETAKPEQVQQPPKVHEELDYEKLSNDELLKAYGRAIYAGHPITDGLRMIIALEMKKRGIHPSQKEDHWKSAGQVPETGMH